MRYQSLDPPIAIALLLEDADLRELDRRTIADVQLVPVAAPEHALAQRGGTLDAAALAGAVQIVLGEHREPAERGTDLEGVFSPRRWRVIDLATKRALITGGLGWGHLPEHLIREDLKAGRLSVLRLEAWGGTPLRRALLLVRRHDAVLGPVARWAQSRLVDLCRNDVGSG